MVGSSLNEEASIKPVSSSQVKSGGGNSSGEWREGIYATTIKSC
jgi:hypothetical protein